MQVRGISRKWASSEAMHMSAQDHLGQGLVHAGQTPFLTRFLRVRLILSVPCLHYIFFSISEKVVPVVR